MRFARPGASPSSVSVEGARRPLGAVEVRAVPIGQGRSVAHVVVPLDQGAWEAILAPSLEAPVFAGRTGYVRGNEGEREGAQVDLIAQADGSRSVLISEVREDSVLCGEARTPVRPRGLDPKTLTLRGATYQRLSPSARAGAKKLVATVLPERAKPPAARALALGGESGALGLAKHLLDGRADTAWFEDRPGIGQGEFVTLRATRELAIERLVFSLADPSVAVAPRTLYLVTPGEVRELTVPEEAVGRSGAEVEVRFAVPLRTECVSLVLGDAYAEGVVAPKVGLAGIAAYSPLEARAIDDVAKALGAPGGDSAAESSAFLKRAGAPGLAAIERVYASLDGAGRARAVDVATSAESCDAAAGVLLRGVVDTDREAARRARDRLERCGKSAAGALRTGLGSADPRLRALSAELFGVVAPREAMAPLTAALGAGDRAERAAVRAALGKATRAAEPEALARLLGEVGVGATLPDRARRVELLRALKSRIGELAGAEEALLGALGGADMSTRFVLVEPARELARAGRPAALTALVDDPDPHVRARAAEAAGGVGALASKLVARIADAEPRVREAALLALASSKSAPARETGAALAGDEWTFVRIAAASALGASAASPGADQALLKALDDRALLVKQAALEALGARRVTAAAGPVAQIARDAEARLELRVAATRALGAICAAGELDLLTRAAQRAIAPVDEADLRVGVAAIDALGRIHPSDLAARLAPLRAKTVRLPLRNAAERALLEPPACGAQK